MIFELGNKLIHVKNNNGYLVGWIEKKDLEHFVFKPAYLTKTFTAMELECIAEKITELEME